MRHVGCAHVLQRGLEVAYERHAIFIPLVSITFNDRDIQKKLIRAGITFGADDIVKIALFIQHQIVEKIVRIDCCLLYTSRCV